MKKYFIIFSLLIAGMALFAQPYSAIIGSTTADADSVIGKTAKSIIIPGYLSQEYDYSYQVMPSLSGSGDSVNIAVALWVANDLDGSIWTEIVSARDSATSTAGVLIEGTDAKNMRHEIVCTGLVLDTVKVQIDYTYKLNKYW